MKLPDPGGNYNAVRERVRNQQIEMADAQNHKRNRDIEVGGGRVILTSPNGARWYLTIDNLGNITATAL